MIKQQEQMALMALQEVIERYGGEFYQNNREPKAMIKFGKQFLVVGVKSHGNFGYTHHDVSFFNVNRYKKDSVLATADAGDPDDLADVVIDVAAQIMKALNVHTNDDEETYKTAMSTLKSVLGTHAYVSGRGVPGELRVDLKKRSKPSEPDGTERYETVVSISYGTERRMLISCATIRENSRESAISAFADAAASSVLSTSRDGGFVAKVKELVDVLEKSVL